jgi:hypothetical protein
MPSLTQEMDFGVKHSGFKRNCTKLYALGLKVLFYKKIPLEVEIKPTSTIFTILYCK